MTVGLLCLILPAATFAQGFTQGDKDLTLNATGTSSDDFDNTTLALSGNLGYFFTPNLEGSVRQSLVFADAPGGSTWGATTSLAVDYNFDLGRWWPFVGGSVGYIYGDDVADGWAVGPEGGVRYFVNDTTYILGMVQFLWTENEGDFQDEGAFTYTLGIGFRW
jgi:hypothetical protein